MQRRSSPAKQSQQHSYGLCCWDRQGRSAHDVQIHIDFDPTIASTEKHKTPLGWPQASKWTSDCRYSDFIALYIVMCPGLIPALDLNWPTVILHPGLNSLSNKYCCDGFNWVTTSICCFGWLNLRCLWVRGTLDALPACHRANILERTERIHDGEVAIYIYIYPK